MEVLKAYMKDPDTYGLFDSDIQTIGEHARRFWNTYLALLLYREATVTVAQGGLITADGKPQKDVF